jgi:hypothetical protein
MSLRSRSISPRRGGLEEGEQCCQASREIWTTLVESFETILDSTAEKHRKWAHSLSLQNLQSLSIPVLVDSVQGGSMTQRSTRCTLHEYLQHVLPNFDHSYLSLVDQLQTICTDVSTLLSILKRDLALQELYTVGRLCAEVNARLGQPCLSSWLFELIHVAPEEFAELDTAMTSERFAVRKALNSILAALDQIHKVEEQRRHWRRDPIKISPSGYPTLSESKGIASQSTPVLPPFVPSSPDSDGQAME